MPRTAKGRFSKLYYNTTEAAGIPDETTPTWSEIDIVKDAKYSIDSQLTDITVRKHGGVKREETALDEVTIEFDIRVKQDMADAAYVKLRDAKVAHTPIEFAMANADITVAGTKALRAVCEITAMGEEQPLGDDVKISFTAKPCDSVNPPRFETTAGV